MLLDFKMFDEGELTGQMPSYYKPGERLLEYLKLVTLRIKASFCLGNLAGVESVAFMVEELEEEDRIFMEEDAAFMAVRWK